MITATPRKLHSFKYWKLFLIKLANFFLEVTIVVERMKVKYSAFVDKMQFSDMRANECMSRKGIFGRQMTSM